MCRRSTPETSIDNRKYVETDSARFATIRTSGWILFGMGFGAIAIGLGFAPNATRPL
jgi:hypothetical protein